MCYILTDAASNSHDLSNTNVTILTSLLTCDHLLPDGVGKGPVFGISCKAIERVAGGKLDESYHGALGRIALQCFDVAWG